MDINIEELKDEIATTIVRQMENMKWELGYPEFRASATYLTDKFLTLSQLPSLIIQNKTLENNSKPQCEKDGHCWLEEEQMISRKDVPINYTCKHCHKRRVKIMKEVLTWED